jgi:hypothetical protein
LRKEIDEITMDAGMSAHHIIESLFEAKDDVTNNRYWFGLKNAFIDSDLLDSMRTNKEFKLAHGLVNQICDSLSNGILDDNYKTLRHQNHFDIANDLSHEVELGDYSIIQSLTLVRKIVDLIRPECELYGLDVNDLCFMSFEVNTMISALNFIVKMRERKKV